MHPIIQNLADRFGAKLSDRIAVYVDKGFPTNLFQWSGAYYDGKSIATRIQHWKLQETGKKDRFGDDELIAVPTQIQEKDNHSLMHEIAHYVIASKEQRELPEYGLGTVAYGLPLGETEKNWMGPDYSHSIPAVVDERESDIQEKMAQLLCIHWGKQYGVSPHMSDYKGTWDQYFDLKFNRELEKLKKLGFRSGTYERNLLYCWEALIRVRQMDNILCRKELNK